MKEKTYSLLRKIEKYTKTDMVYLASGGFWLFLKTAISAVVAFTISVAFANLLPKTTYGEYKYIFSMFGLLAIPTLTGMGTAATKSVAQGFEGTPSAALRTKIRWGLLGSAASASIAVYYAVQGNLELAGAFLLVMFFLPFVDTLSIYNSVLTGKKLFRISTIYEIIVQFISAIAIITALFLTNSLLIVLAVYFITFTIVRFFIFRAVIKRHTENPSVDKETTKYGKHLSVMDILSTVSDALDSILLWQFVGPAPVAVYAFAKGIPVQVSVAMQRIMTLAFPKFAQRDFQTIRSSLVHKMLLMFLVMLIVVILYILAAPYIFQLFFPAYTEAIIYSQIFSLTLLFFPQKFIGTAFQAHARTKSLYVFTTITPIVRMGLAFSLIPFFGIIGAIATELIGRAVNFCILTMLMLRAKT